MASGTVGVKQAAGADRLIDNTQTTVSGQTVYRQRVDPVPSATSTYYSGTSGSVNVPTSQQIVAVACHCTTAGSLTIGGGTPIPVPANSQFSDSFPDAPIVGTGAGSVVFTGTDSYYVRVIPVIT